MNKNAISLKRQNDTIELDQNLKISDLISTLISQDPLEKSTREFVLSIDESDNVTLKKSTTFEAISELSHPFFSQNHKYHNPCELKIELNLDEMNNVIIFSPHPDDDILGSCALIHKLIEMKKNVKVVYMTSGKSAGANRKEEAEKAINVLGGNLDNICFIDMPFYQKTDKNLTEEDQIYLSKFLKEQLPSNIFICADIFDPHLTHRKCFQAILNCIEGFKEDFKNIQSYFYYSVWYNPKENEYNHIIPYDFDIYKKKVIAMLEHKSQFETKFMGNDSRPFYQRAISRDSEFGKKHGYSFCEVFYKLKA